MRIGWAVVGCGDIANKRVAPAICSQPDSDLVAFCSRGLARAEEMRERHGARRAYDSLEATLADRDVAAVYVASPPARHRS